MLQFLRFNLCSLVQKNDVAELNLLDDERSQIFLINILLHQVAAVGEFILHTQSIYYGNDAVKAQNTILDVLRTEGWDRADGLCNRSRLADSGSLDDNVIETLHVYDFLELFYQVHLQCAADATILERNERIIFLTYYATFFYKGCINIDFTNIVDDDGKLNTFFVS